MAAKYPSLVTNESNETVMRLRFALSETPLLLPTDPTAASLEPVMKRYIFDLQDQDGLAIDEKRAGTAASPPMTVRRS